MLPFVHLVMPDDVLAEVVAHARRDLPNECCGLIAGTISNNVGVASVSFPITNDATRSTEYETNPHDMLFAFRAIRESGQELLAIYHSHPTSAPVPSRRDRARNSYGESVVHIIVGFAGNEPEVRAWWLSEDDARAAEFSKI